MLKRWQIGEIASKIGQLYYHYYLRTSETNYLNETFSFYAAIRARGYYNKASKEERSDLMVKKLRYYYARFIVVCLLLKKMKLVKELVRGKIEKKKMQIRNSSILKKLAKQIDDYTSTYEPEDQLEWSLVLGEIKSFIEADNLVNITDVNSAPVVLSHRLNPLNSPPVEKLPTNHLTLQEILIVGNCCDQPPDNGDQRPAKRENPHKYLLYKPNISQLIVFLSSGFKELPP
ncbi:protein SCAI [Caerostris extrusa]|uniref:Protein SCAI n=1 Tax=Caerostris extrusa TaxID=172846 RepID=A0AAV4QL35_CAEEX|nr:protein SCAI [Caerostris extrusa]